jgi:flagellar biosynthesis component FlhA
MNVRRLNWPLWVGFLLTLGGAFSFLLIFVWIPATRDFPWANLLIFLIAIGFLVVGVRRGFASDRKRPIASKIVASLVALFSFAMIALFIFSVFVVARWLPPSKGAPQVGQKAPEFTLQDTSGKQVSLTQLLSEPVNGTAPKSVLLVFYRGYW